MRTQRESLTQKKESHRESYDSVLKKLLEKEDVPSMEEMFNYGDKMKQKRFYSADEVVKLTHELRGK